MQKLNSVISGRVIRHMFLFIFNHLTVCSMRVCVGVAHPVWVLHTLYKTDDMPYSLTLYRAHVYARSKGPFDIRMIISILGL